MKKIQLAEEAGRAMAQKRYGSPKPTSSYGHSQMGRNVKGKYQFATGGGVPGGRGPFPGQTEKQFQEGEEKRSRQRIFAPSQTPGMVEGSMEAPWHQATEDERKVGR